jgi:hypothetical protein
MSCERIGEKERNTRMRKYIISEEEFTLLMDVLQAEKETLLHLSSNPDDIEQETAKELALLQEELQWQHDKPHDRGGRRPVQRKEG